MWVHVLLFGLVLGWLPGARATVYRDAVYDVTSLAEELIHVDIRSNIPGTIRWKITDDDTVTVSLNISAENQPRIDDVTVHFRSNTSACALHIDSISRQKAAAVTGTGNRGGHVVILIWLTLFTLNWRYVHVLLVLLVANGLVHCMAEESEAYKDDRRVDIEVRAPKRFRYRDSSLVMVGGRVRVINTGTKLGDISGIACSTGYKTPTECATCCHGNGVCSNNRCDCDEGYSPEYNCSYNPEYNCRTPIRDDTFFSHPLDPRLVRTVTSSGDVITLSDISNSKDKIGKIKSQELVYLDIHSKLNMTSVFFSSDGFIKRIQSHTGNITHVLQIKRSSDVICKSTLVASTDAKSVDSQMTSKLVFDVDACGETVKMELRKPLKTTMTKAERNRRLRNRISSKSSRIMNTLSSSSTLFRTYNPAESGPYVDIPVSAQRCGQERAIDYSVVFEMKSRDASRKSEMTSRDPKNRNSKIMKEESVFLSTYTVGGMRNKNGFLRLPKGQWTKGRSKLSYTVNSMTKVCNKYFLSLYTRICGLTVQENSKSTSSLLFTFVDVCSSVLKAMVHVCDFPLRDEHLKDSIQERSFTNLVKVEDLFSASVYSLRPHVTYADGKIILGNWITISSLSLNKIQTEGIVVKDDKPEVKISHISVVPTDPVPQDIYHVRLDYTCATNQTVIRMNVTGSDLYKNHATCTGVTECGCCILHAAGAPDAVVDHVTINITDPLSGVHIVKEMMVIF